MYVFGDAGAQQPAEQRDLEPGVEFLEVSKNMSHLRLQSSTYGEGKPSRS